VNFARHAGSSPGIAGKICLAKSPVAPKKTDAFEGLEFTGIDVSGRFVFITPSHRMPRKLNLLASGRSGRAFTER
jgi:hypothetical protein